MTIEDNIKKLNIILPKAADPVGSYVATKISGKLLYISGQISMNDKGELIKGKLGKDLKTEDGYNAAKRCALSIVAQAKKACNDDLSLIKSCVKLTGYVNSTEDFVEQPKVINGASDMIASIFGDIGMHTRAAVSTNSLPLGVAVDGSGIALDVDMDNVPDYRDADPFSNRGAQVDVNGVELDDDKDGVPNSKDLESNTPVGTMVNQFGINISNTTFNNSGGLTYFPSIYFNSGSAVVGSSNENRIATMALLLRNNQDINLNVIGHTDNVGNTKFNRELGLKRANEVINYLVSNYKIDSKDNVVKFANLKLKLVDISNTNLCMCPKDLLKKINKNTLAIFITHAMGFNGLTEKFIKFIKCNYFG
mgnify:CR=1 FL=1